MGIYEDLGITPIINATGSVTRLGGAPMPPAVVEALKLGATEAVVLDQLQAAASRVIAELTGTEAGLVTAGAAAALTLGTAAILTRFDPARMDRLPHTRGMAHEFVVAREQRNGYDHAVRAAGVRLVEVGMNELVSGAGVRRAEIWEYEAAFRGRTAGVLFVQTADVRPALAEVVAAAHARGLPVLVDAAAELPPRANLKAIPATGADLVCFSGGKAIRGPQSTGILCGRRDLVAAAALQMLDLDDHPELWDPPGDLFKDLRLPGLPRQGLGRGLKASKEEIVALLAALRLFASGGYDAEVATYRPRLERIAAALAGCPVTCALRDAGDGESFPVLAIKVDQRALGQSAFDLCRRLRRGSPPIYLGHSELQAGVLLVHPLCLDDEKAALIADRLRAALHDKS